MTWLTCSSCERCGPWTSCIDYAGLIWCLVISKDTSRASSYTGEGVCSLYWLCQTYLVFGDEQRSPTVHPRILVKVFAHYIDYARLIWCLVISKDRNCASSYTGEGVCSLYWLCQTYLVFGDEQRPPTVHPRILVKVFAHYIDYARLIWCLVISKDRNCASSYTGEGVCSLYWLCQTYLVFSDQQRSQLCILVYWWRCLLIILIMPDLSGV